MPASPTATPEHIKDVNTRYHDAAASEYDAKWGIDFGDIGQDQVRGKLVKALGGAAGDTFEDALEIGSGTGYFSLNLVQLGLIANLTATDISPGMLDQLAATAEDLGLENVTTVVTEAETLPFEDESFDLVICFEAIEHVEGPEKALAELRRVLRPGGVLIVSSPNPDAYVGGNEFHVHEFRPAELVEAVGSLFEHVASYRQDAWLGSAISAAGNGANGNGSPELLFGGAPEGEGPPYSVAVASDGELPAMEGLLAVGDAFDARWWAEQVDNARAETLHAVEREQSALRRLQDTSNALLGANQELAQIPLLRHRLASLEEKYGDLSERHSKVLESTSWRITAPLRRRKG
jgi:ubiquinone/menaquinone biosynthesis C-methylase UbiE